jgi:hypothetical protein
MVTHGYVIFKYKGIYYTFYNHADSYFEYLGDLVVEEINKMIKEYKVEYYKGLLLRVPLVENYEGERQFEEFNEMLNDPTSFHYFTSTKEPYNEYTYTIDFDTNKFIANQYGENIYIFNLHNIPLDWYEITQNNSNYNQLANDADDADDESDQEILNKIKELENNIQQLKLRLKKN